MSVATLTRWPHQIYAVEEVIKARDESERIIVLTSPTGAGKSVMMCDLIEYALERFEKTVLYTNRKMLTEQTGRVMQKHGIRHGVRAAGWEPDLQADVQIASIQTEHSKQKRVARDLHEANLVLIDEGHLNKGAIAQAICQKHLEAGATIVFVTATPVDMGNICGITPKLIVAGRNSELRKCGALVPALHYGPSEPDTRKVRKQVWEYTEADVRKLVMVHGIFGIVEREWKRLNPDQLPTLLFAPGVAESIWFAEQFRAAGIRAAHIDGKNCWLDGEFHQSNQDIRDRIIGECKDGSIKVICNRFVLREGIDLPWMRHGILATVFSTVQAYLQSCGRLLRAYPGKDAAIVQDHGGNWHKHGSLNADRNWELDYTLTENQIQGMRSERLMEKQEPEPFLCPKCRKVLTSSACICGYVVTRKSRPVVQADGRIHEYEGDIYKPRKVSMKSDTLKIWEQCYWRARNSRKGMTFRQAAGLFFYENFYYPPKDLPMMPLNELDWYRLVSDVPREKLHAYGEAQE